MHILRTHQFSELDYRFPAAGRWLRDLSEMRAIAACVRTARVACGARAESLIGVSDVRRRVAGSGGQIRRDLLRRAEEEVILLLLL